MLKVTPTSTDRIMSHVRSDDRFGCCDKLVPGLYSWSEQHYDDEGDLDTWSHFISYLNEDQALWSIEDDGMNKTTYFSIRVVDYREAHDVGKEAFLGFVRNKTPEAMEWLMFNADLLR